MLCYADLVIWSKRYGLLCNRVKVVNQLHGCRYEQCPTNPCRLVYARGSYSVYYFGLLLCAFGVYDVNGVTSALGFLDSLADVVWSCSSMLGC